MGDLQPPQLRIDPLSGLRVIVTGEDGVALEPGGALAADPLALGRGEPDLFASGPATGVNEVIDPPAALIDLGADGLAEVMSMWRLRMREHAESPYVQLSADETGTAQLYALPFVPAAVARERERFTAYFERTQGRNLLADVLQEEVRRRDRIVVVGDGAVAICPFASRSPFHVQLVPRASRARFEDDGDTGAATLFEVLKRLEAALDGLPPLNLWIRTAPSGATAFCWRIDMVVARAQPAGLELGAGVALCSLAPEQAAEALREAEL